MDGFLQRASTLREHKDPFVPLKALPAGARITRPLGKAWANRGYASCRGDGTSHVAPSRHHEGGGNLHGLVELFRSAKPNVIKTPRGPVYPPPLMGSFPCFSLYESCGAVSR